MRVSGVARTAKLTTDIRTSPTAACRKTFTRVVGTATSCAAHISANAGLAADSRSTSSVHAGSPRRRLLVVWFVVFFCGSSRSQLTNVLQQRGVTNRDHSRLVPHLPWPTRGHIAVYAAFHARTS